MADFLCLDTSQFSFSLALFTENKLTRLERSQENQTASSHVSVVLEEWLAKGYFSPQKLSAIMVASGPGSFTGLRIGAATAKGLCFAWTLPLITVNTLESLWAQAKSKMNEDAFYIPMLDARRMEVYCLVANNNQLVEPTQAKILDEQSFERYWSTKPTYFFGDGAEKFKPLLNHPNAKFVEGIHPSAEFVGHVGWAKWQAGLFTDVVNYEPEYGKEFYLKTKP